MATPARLMRRIHGATPGPRQVRLNELEKRLLDAYQQGFPLSPRPFAEIAAHLGTSESLVLSLLARLQAQGVISRVGPVFRPHRIGVSTLAAMAVPDAEMERVAEVINGYEEVNHNYEREHRFNLWFVVTAPDRQRLAQVLTELHQRTGYRVLDLPLLRQYHIDLGFPLWD